MREDAEYAQLAFERMVEANLAVLRGDTGIADARRAFNQWSRKNNPKVVRALRESEPALREHYRAYFAGEKDLGE